MAEYICLNLSCKKKFKSAQWLACYCSASCRTQAYRTRKKMTANKVRAQKQETIKKTCENCVNEFESSTWFARFCSSACSMQAYRRRKKANQQLVPA